MSYRSRRVCAFSLLTASLALGCIAPAGAGTYVCTGGAQMVGSPGHPQCSDGSIPVYGTTPLVTDQKRPPPPPPAPAPRPRRSADGPRIASGPISSGLVQDLRCQGVRCGVAEGMQPGLTTIELSGGSFRAYAKRGVTVVVLDAGGQTVFERKSGVIGKKGLGVSIPAFRLAQGRYRLDVLPPRGGEALATGAFAVTGAAQDKPRPAPKKTGPAGATGP